MRVLEFLNRWRGTRIIRNRGAGAAVEFGLLSSLLVLVLIGTLEFARLLWTYNALEYSVEQASRCGILPASAPCKASSLAAYAASKSYGVNLSSAAFTATTATCGQKVSASLPFTFVMTKLLPYSITLTASYCRTVQPTA